MKIIVTHQNPDLDAVCAVWLLRRFGGKHLEKARVVFVPAGETYRGAVVDADPDVIHVDTGLGRFDHHQSDTYTSAAEKVFESLGRGDRALKRMVAVVVRDDHAKDVERDDAADDIWQFWFAEILSGWRSLYPGKDEDHLLWGMRMLDGIYHVMRGKVAAEEELQHGVPFQTQWGKGIACATTNDTVLDVGVRQGYVIVIRKDPRKQYVRMTGRSDKGVDLTHVFSALRRKDADATWYLHPSKVLIRNGSTKNPNMKPTTLTLEEIIAVFQKKKEK